MSLKNTCRRCGTCCRKGGPSFHHEDRHLVERGIIEARSLYTIRKGEPAWDNVLGRVMPVDSDIIKIKGKKGGWACIFFDEAGKCCTIYEHRPVECRTLKCWDTRDIEKIYNRNRLIRQELIGQVRDLWSLVENHQARCSYDTVYEIVNRLHAAPHEKDVMDRLYDMLEYDRQIRTMMSEKAEKISEMTEFLFGRPLAETVAALGISLEKEGRCFSVIPKP